MNKYIVKNQNNKQNKNVFGMTDYDIPMFGFKSALLILISTLSSVSMDSLISTSTSDSLML